MEHRFFSFVSGMRFRERLFPQWLWRLPFGEKKVALTFDDGPNPHSTPKLLAVLERLQIPTTMFFVGRRCADHKSLVRECAAAGHHIAIHGYSHESFLWRSSHWQRESILRTANAIADSRVEYQHLVRPPYGRFNAATSRVLSSLGFTGVLWSQIVDDWVEQRPNILEHKFLNDLRDGNIIVLHDKPRNIENVLNVLPRVADEIRRRGWQFTTLAHPLDSIR